MKIDSDVNAVAEWPNAKPLPTTFFDTSPHIDRANPEDFIHLFNSSEQLIEFLEHLLRNTTESSQIIYDTLVSLKKSFE